MSLGYWMILAFGYLCIGSLAVYLMRRYVTYDPGISVATFWLWPVVILILFLSTPGIVAIYLKNPGE